MSVKYVGRLTNFEGKTLWELVGNLKNFGVGRIIIRSTQQRYEEKCYMKIVKVEALPNEDPRKVKVTVQKTFRGNLKPNLTEIESTSYKADYKLIPKSEEQEFCKITKKQPLDRVISNKLEFPPLMKEFVRRDFIKKNLPVPEDLKLQMNILKSSNNVTKVVQDGQATEVHPIGFGTPASPSLFKNMPTN